jgi:hypothetical protein
MQRLTHVKAGTTQKETFSVITERLGDLSLAINQISGVARWLILSYTEFLKIIMRKALGNCSRTRLHVHGE